MFPMIVYVFIPSTEPTIFRLAAAIAVNVPRMSTIMCFLANIACKQHRSEDCRKHEGLVLVHMFE